MSLDLTRVVSQVGEMVSRLKSDSEEKRRHLQQALDTAGNDALDLDGLKKKITDSKTTWLVAGLVDGLARRYPATPLPDEFTVIASDGSHIDVDRNQSIRCYLINIGSVALHYGASPGAVLESHPRLYAGDEDLVIRPAGARGREQPVEGALLGIKRGVDECRRLTEMAAELPPNSTTLALLDGTLILWGLEAYPEFVSEALLDKGLLSCFNEMRSISRKKQLALASYISYPRSNDVVNTLRVALCPQGIVDSDRCCPTCQSRECDAVSGVRDRELFAGILDRGERSALFISRSSVVRKRYGEHQIYFFYLRLDDEIARVEIPEWVARDESLLNLTHCLVLDQCRRGQGYPVALSEAHEQAVVTTADRENFWALVESLLVDEKLPATTSAKSFSKKTRWV
ncbi:MAG: DNA double-strand break repair nuclease NurA [Dehalococcoidales bacterium]|nr:DNA double-strand break repair nuclease NurA [Dehalococcoidales bacterium]